VSAGARARVVALLRRHGWNATSFQVIEPEFRYWFDDGGHAAVAYVEAGGAWVVAGPPIASLADLRAIADRFVVHARSRGRRVAFFAVERRFLARTGMRSLAIGEQPSWDPQQWSARQAGHRSMREQLRRARAKGVVVSRVASEEAAGALRPELDRLLGRWLGSRKMPPMSFLVALEPFAFPEERRYYVARRGEEIAGLLVAVPVYDRDGWFFEDIVRDPAAPNGTAESLVDAAMRDVAESGCRFVTLGLAPLAGDGRWLRGARRIMRGFYDFEGVRAFKARLRPDSWETIHLAWPAGRTAGGALYDVLNAFAAGRIGWFAVRSVLRAPRPVLVVLAALLVPWTAILATAETSRWFPSARVQFGWVAFDVAMFGALVALARGWRQPLALAAATAALADAALTTVDAVRWNVPRARHVRDALVIVAAIVAPFAAAAILFGGVHARSTRFARPSARTNMVNAK
jgi:phosphatidylglycerol lysyltransferase